MRNNLITIGLIAAAALIIAGLYWYQPAQVVTNTATTTPDGSGVSTTIITSTTTTPAATTTPQAVAFRVIATGTNAANVSARKNIAVYSQTEYQNLWNMAQGPGADARPVVNFAKEYVIGVFAGQKSTGGYAISVTSVVDTGNTRTLTVTLTRPGPSCIVTQALTSPFQLIVVPLRDVTHANKDVEVVTTCS